MSKFTSNSLCVLNVLACAVLILMNVGFLFAECPKQINCKSTNILSCTDYPNANGVCPGRHEDVYKNGFGGSDGTDYTCEDSDETSQCVFNCPCIRIPSGYILIPDWCEPNYNDSSCQLTRAFIKEQVPKGA